jgi:hypothetical protein
MIETMPGMPDNVLAFSAKGQVTGEDYESILIPAVEAALKKHNRVRLLYHLGPEFSGFEMAALWDDTKVGLRHLSAWEKIAVVTDADWVRHSVTFFGFLIPAEVRVFGNHELAAAAEWLQA